MTITVKPMYDPTADVAAWLAAYKAKDAPRVARSAVTSALFAADQPEQFRLLIDGVHIHEVKGATLFKSLDCASDGFTAVIPVHEELRLFRDKLLSPPGYPVAEVYLGGKKRFTGRLYERQCKFANAAKYRTLVGWSPIVDALDSVATPPYEKNMMTLTALASAWLAPFGIAVIWKGGVDLPFTRVKIKRDEKIGDVLFKLARQRGIFVMSDENGNVVLHQPADGLPVAMLTEGLPPFDNAEMKLDGRKWFGQYVCFGTHPRGNKQVTATDDRFPIGRRTVVEAPEGSDADMKTTAEWAARKAFADGLEFPWAAPSWYPSALPGSDIWLPNTLVRVTSPTLFLSAGFDFLTRSVEYRWEDQGARAQLDFVSPTAYQTLAVQKKAKLSWQARMMMAKLIATPLEKTLMDEPAEEF